MNCLESIFLIRNGFKNVLDKIIEKSIAIKLIKSNERERFNLNQLNSWVEK
jgi:hypothetical protein